MPTDRRFGPIRQYESGDQNIPNYMYDDEHTAQGYYQITNTNWRAYAPKVGIDLDEHPTAMHADEPTQRKVADYLLNHTPMGERNWTDFNPKLRAALARGEGDMASPAQIDYSKMSDAELIELARKDPELSKLLKPAKGPSKPSQDPTTSLFKQIVTSPTPESEQHFKVDPFSQGGYVVPGLKKIGRGLAGIFTGDPDYEPAESRYRSGISDITEGIGDIAVPVGIGATIGAPAGALYRGGGEILGLLPKLGEAGLKSAGWGFGLHELGKNLSDDPETQRMLGDVGGLAGGLLGPGMGFPKGGKIGAGAFRAGKYIPGINKIPGWKMAMDYMADSVLQESATGKAAAAPKGDVKGPPKTAIPTREESVNGLRYNRIDEQDFLDHEKLRGSDPKVAQQQLDIAKGVIDKERFDMEDKAREQNRQRLKEQQAEIDKIKKDQERRAREDEKREIERKKMLQEEYDRADKQALEREKRQKEAEKLARERQEEEERRRFPKVRPSVDINAQLPPVKTFLPGGVTIEPPPAGSGPTGPPQGGNVLGMGGTRNAFTAGTGMPQAPVQPPPPPQFPPGQAPTGPGVQNVMPPGTPVMPGGAPRGTFGSQLTPRPQQPVAPPPAPAPSGTPANTQITPAMELPTPGPKGIVNRPGANITGAAPEIGPGATHAGTPLGNVPTTQTPGSIVKAALEQGIDLSKENFKTWITRRNLQKRLKLDWLPETKDFEHALKLASGFEEKKP